MRHILIAIVAVALTAGCSSASGASGGPEASADGSSQSPATVWAIGDSIMVGATDLLTGARPDLVIDAEVGRTFAQGLATLASLTAAGETPDALIFALGTNNGATPDQIADLVALAEGIERVILVTVVVPRGWEDGTNAAIVDAEARYGSVTVADWYAVAAGDTSLFRSDGYHPNADGLAVWADLVLTTVE